MCLSVFMCVCAAAPLSLSGSSRGLLQFSESVTTLAMLHGHKKILKLFEHWTQLSQVIKGLVYVWRKLFRNETFFALRN